MCFKNVVRRSGAFLSALVLCFSLAMPVLAAEDDGGYTTSYTLFNLSGSYITSSYYYYDSGSSATQESASYSVGSFPLIQQTYIWSDKGYTMGNMVSDCTSRGVDAHAGDVVNCVLLFPAVSISYLSTLSDWQYVLYYYFCGVKNEGESYSDMPMLRIAFTSSGALSALNGSSTGFSRFASLFDEDSFLSSSVLDSSGNIIGVQFSGTLLRDLDYFYSNLSLSHSKTSKGPSGYITLTYDSYSDLQLVVSHSSSCLDSSGSSGDSGSSGESSSTATTPTMTILSTQVFDTSGSVVGLVDGIDLSDGTYSVKSVLGMGDLDDITSADSDDLLSDELTLDSVPFYIHHSFKGLSPETEYTCLYALLKDGEPIAYEEDGTTKGVSASTTFTTQASSAFGDDTGGSSGDSGTTDLSSVLSSLDAIRAEQKTQTSLLQQIKDFLTGKTDKSGEYTSELEDQSGVSKDSIKDKKTDIEAFNNQGYGITEDVQTGLAVVVPLLSSFSFVFDILAIFIGLGVLGIIVKRGMS